MIELMAPGGYLFLGYSERVPPQVQGLEAVSVGGVYAWRRSTERVKTSGTGGVVRPETGERLTRGVGASDRGLPASPRHTAEWNRPPRSQAQPSERSPSLGVDGASEALALSPGEAELQTARALADAGSYAEAIEHAYRATTLSPLSEDGHALVGSLLMREGRLEEAMAAFERALYLAPESPLVRFQYACLLREMGKAARARREFESLAAWLERRPLDQPVGELSAGLLLSACRE